MENVKGKFMDRKYRVRPISISIKELTLNKSEEGNRRQGELLPIINNLEYPKQMKDFFIFRFKKHHKYFCCINTKIIPTHRKDLLRSREREKKQIPFKGMIIRQFKTY